VVELIGELKALHKQDRVKLINEQAAESQQFDLKIEQDFIALLERQLEEQRQYKKKALNDKREFDGRQQDALNQLIKTRNGDWLPPGWSWLGKIQLRSCLSKICSKPTKLSTTKSEDPRGVAKLREPL